MDSSVLNTFEQHEVTDEFSDIFKTTVKELSVLNGIDTAISTNFIDQRIFSIRNAAKRTEELWKKGHVIDRDYHKALDALDEIDGLVLKKRELRVAGNQIAAANEELLRVAATGSRTMQSAAKQQAIRDHTEAIEKMDQEIAQEQKIYNDSKATMDKINGDMFNAWDKESMLQKDLDVLKELKVVDERVIENVAGRLAKASANVERLEGLVDTVATPARDLAAKAGDLMMTLKSKLIVANDVLQKAKIYEAGDIATNKIMQTLAKSIAEYTDPAVKFTRKMDNIFKVIKDGYTDLAAELVEGKDASRFLKQVQQITDDETEVMTDRMERQIKELDELISAEGSPDELSDAVLSKVAEWMSPTWQLKAAQLEDIMSIIEDAKNFGLVEAACILVKGLALLVKSVIRAPLFIIAKTLEVTIGKAAATVLADAIGATIEVSLELAHAYMSPSTQAVLLALYGFIDAFHVHNFGSWVNDMVSFVVSAALADKIFSLRLLQYPKTSGPSTINEDKEEPVHPEAMWEIDHRELAFSIDFWAKTYLEQIAMKQGKDKKSISYTKYQEFGGIRRIPGKYIELDNHPYDTQDEIDECQRVEKSLDLGNIIDETGEMTGVDLGGNLVSTVLPKKEGFVRNLINFPLYKNTLVWPNRDGEFLQTRGNDNQSSLDPGIYNVWVNMVTTGRYGFVFNHPNSSIATQRKAIATNLLDYQQFLHPSPDDPNVWDDVNSWANGNVGIRTVMSQDMHKVTLDVLEREERTDLVLEDDQVDIKDEDDKYSHFVPVEYNKFQYKNQDTLDFTNYQFEIKGRYLYTPTCKAFYNRVVSTGVVKYITHSSPLPPFSGDSWGVATRKALPNEIAKYTRILKQFVDYKKALLDKHNSIADSWDRAFKENLWAAFVSDTSPRNIWGYVKKIRTVLITELQYRTNMMLGKNKAAVWTKYLKSLEQLRTPLDTNRYHRLSFVGRFNQLIYSDTPERAATITQEIEKMGGNILENQLFTTGLSKNDALTWAKGVIKTAIYIPSIRNVDIPLYFGKIHCRVIVIDKPKQTCFIVFRGTTNFWEWVVDADFSGAEYGHIQSNPNGHYSLEISDKTETAGGDLESLFYGDPDNFALHRGFLRCWLAFKPQLIPYLDKVYKRHDIQNVIVTGHSLGAGITQIACLELPSLPIRKSFETTALAQLSGLSPTHQQVTYYRPHAYMYSSPAVGDRRFTWHFMNQTAESAHVYIDGDLITMSPPFLLPALESWGHAAQTSFLNDLKILASADAGAAATVWTAISYIFKVENISNPFAWMTSTGKIDMKKVKGRMTDLFVAYNKHKASKGGGIFFRLDNDLSGSVFETSTDPGSTVAAIALIFDLITTFSTARLERYHSIDNVVQTLDKVVLKHPDIFSEIDKEEQQDNPTWENIEIMIPPKLNPIPRTVETQIKQGKLIAIARSKKRYLPYQIVLEEDIIPGSIVRVIDYEETERCHNRQIKRRQIRKVTEGDYHGY